MTNIEQKEEEIWVPIIGFEGRYEVSNLARVRSLGFIRNISVYKKPGFLPGRILKLLTCRPYHSVTISDSKGKRYYPLVYDLVFFSFNPHIEKRKGFEIDHRDGNKWNSCLSNLQYITKRQNISKGFALNKTDKTSRYTGVYWQTTREKWVSRIVINKETVFLGRFDNETDAATAYNTALDKVEKELFDRPHRPIKTSKYKGVRKNLNSKGWSVLLKGKYIGTFATEEEAAQAYQTALNQLQNKAA